MNVMTTPSIDELMDRYYQLAGQANIEDTRQYSEAWEGLAAQFAANDRPAMAANCSARARQYRQLAELMTGFTREPGVGCTMLKARTA